MRRDIGHFSERPTPAERKRWAEADRKTALALGSPEFQRAVNRLLKPHGLVVRSRGNRRTFGDRVLLWVEPLGSKPK